MSRFHDELIAARRRGDAPGQTGSLVRVPVAFDDVQDVPLVACSRRFGAVPVDRVTGHTDWHAQISA